MPIYLIVNHILNFMVNHKIFRYFLNVKIASLNCRGLNDNIKRNLLFQKFRQSDTTIFCLQETKLNPDKEFQYINEWDKGPSFFNSVKGGKRGTAILFNTNSIIVKKSIMDETGRVISLDICVGGKILHLINTYFPNDNNEQYKFIYDQSQSQVILLAGIIVHYNTGIGTVIKK